MASAIHAYYAYNEWVVLRVAGSSIGEAFFWDADIYADAGRCVASGCNPYGGHVAGIPGGPVFIAPPAAAAFLGGLHGLFGAALPWLLKLGHLAAMAVAPLILSRYFLGPSVSAAILGYGLFFCGIAGTGTMTLVSGNFGSVLYLAAIATMMIGIRSGRWHWYHAAVAVAVQFKPVFALFWLIPVMADGWSWRECRNGAMAAFAAGGVFLVFYVIEPGSFHDWLSALYHQVHDNEDRGYSVYGVAMRKLESGTALPLLLHLSVCGALFAFLWASKSSGPMRLAAILTLAILANPRMKDYDAVFGSIAVGALILTAMAPSGASALRRAVSTGLTALLFVAFSQFGYRLAPVEMIISMLALTFIKADRCPGRNDRDSAARRGRPKVTADRPRICAAGFSRPRSP